MNKYIMVDQTTERDRRHEDTEEGEMRESGLILWLAISLILLSSLAILVYE